MVLLLVLVVVILVLLLIVLWCDVYGVDGDVGVDVGVLAGLVDVVIVDGVSRIVGIATCCGVVARDGGSISIGGVVGDGVSVVVE